MTVLYCYFQHQKPLFAVYGFSVVYFWLYGTIERKSCKLVVRQLSHIQFQPTKEQKLQLNQKVNFKETQPSKLVMRVRFPLPAPSQPNSSPLIFPITHNNKKDLMCMGRWKSMNLTFDVLIAR